MLFGILGTLPLFRALLPDSISIFAIVFPAVLSAVIQREFEWLRIHWRKFVHFVLPSPVWSSCDKVFRNAAPIHPCLWLVARVVWYQILFCLSFFSFNDLNYFCPCSCQPFRKKM
jgi:hypothetical protein